MKSLLKFIQKFHFIILFLFIEVLSLTLVVTYNKDQKHKFANSSNTMVGGIYNTYSGFTDYLNLKVANLELANENAEFRNSLKGSFKSNRIIASQIVDSILSQQYSYIPAKITNNSVNKQFNYITLNKGSKHGVKTEMAVISPTGVIGVVNNVSRNYSTAISILNENIMISSKHKKTGYYGSLKWDKEDYTKSQLYEIPSHAKIAIGDTIVTSGYSAMFPDGIMIGTINDFVIDKGSSFYNITVDLSVNCKNASYVYIIDNLLKTEQENLESSSND